MSNRGCRVTSIPNDKPRRLRRILYLDHTGAMGGGEIALLNLLKHLDRSRYHPVVALFAEGPLAGRLSQAGIENHLLALSDSVAQTRKESLKGWGLLRGDALAQLLGHVRRVARFIAGGHYDLVHANSLKSDIIGGLAGKLAGTPVLWHVRDRIHADYLPWQAVIGFRTACCLLPDFVAANSQATLDLLRPAFARVRGQRQARRRMRVIHDGVTADAFVEARIESSKAAPARITIGLVGRIAQWKGQEIFVRAAAAVLARYPGCRFRIIGAALFSEQDYETSVRRLVRDLRLEHTVEFTGFRADVAEAIAELDILVHASITGEPFGQVIVEGMAAGKPVVATNGGGVPEIVQDQVTGLLIPMGDPNAMADAICRLLADPSAAAEMGNRGRERVRQHFRIENTARKMEEFYRSMMPGLGV